MATISGVQGNWQVDLVVNEVSINPTNIENNTSSANWSLIIRRTDSGNYPMYGTPTINISISGKTAYSDSKYFAISSITKSGVTLLSGTVTDIEHNDNGTIKNNSINFTWSGSGFSPSSVSASGTYTAATIPRASSIAVGNYNLGQNISITIGKKVDSFTSTLTYKIGNRTGTIIEKTKEPSYIWEMPDELIIQIKQDNPSNAKPSATIYCDTYSGDTKIGDTKSATFNLYITDKPTISDVEIKETIDLIKLYTASIVKYLSVPQFNITANSSKGTSITTYKLKINDREIISYTNGLTVNNIQYSYLVDDVRKTKFIVTVTDARGNTSEEYPVEVDFIEYVQLVFNNTDIKLTRLNGTSNYMKLHMTGYIYNGLIGETPNTLTLQYRYKLKNDALAEWSELKSIEAALNEDNTFIVDNFQLKDEFDYRENYDIEFYADDLFVPAFYNTVIKTSETTVKVHKNGLDAKNLTINYKQVLYEGIQEKYSTEEQIIGTCMGKPLYSKFVAGTTNGNSIALNLISNVDKIIEHSIYIKRADVNQWHLLSGLMTGGDHVSPLFLDDDANEVRLYITLTVFRSQEFYGWVKYTKTTDIVEEVNNDI